MHQFLRHIAYLFLFLVALPATASAQDTLNLVIPTFYSQEGDDLVARRFSEEVRLAAGRVPGWSVTDNGVGIIQLADANRCSMSLPDCMRQMIETVGAQLMLAGFVHRRTASDGVRLVVELSLYDRRTSSVTTTHDVTLSEIPDAAELRTEAIAAVAAMLPPYVAPVVAVVPPVDEDETDVDPARSAPVVSDDFPELEQPVAHPPESHEWLGFTMIGVGAALVLAEIGVLARLNDINGDAELSAYRLRVPPDGNICSAAASGMGYVDPTVDAATAASQASEVNGLCGEAGSLEIVQVVLPVLGALIAGTGTTLLLTGALGGGAAPVSVAPSVSADRAGLTLFGSF